MTFADLLTELYARGFSYLNDGGDGATRAGRWINFAYKQICEKEEWPWLYADATGAPPLAIADLRAILSVTDSTNDNVLERIDRRTLVEWYPDLPDTGTPEYYYRDSETSIKVYPANTGVSLSVRYCKVPADLSGVLEPVIPARWQDLIVDGAVLYAKKDDDTWDQLKAAYDQAIGEMIASYSFSDLSTPEYQVLYGPSGDSVGRSGGW